MSTSDIEKQEKKRAMIINEIVSSEQTYLTRLLITRDVFMRPIQDKSLLSKEDIDGQFGELNAIVNLHEILSHSLTQAHEQGTLEVGRVFSDICSEFSVYKGYLKCFEKALVKRGKLITSNRKFADYLVEAKADPRCQGFSMESLLIEPVQRIPRYRLLLEDLLKSTLPSHTDYESIKNALESICIIAAENNEAIRQQEELDKVYQVMQQMEYKGSINLLDNEDRKFLKQNDLMRQCRRGRKSFRFWLFNDLLLYGEASKPLILGKYNLNRDIPLNQCNVSSEDEGEEYVMTVESPSKSFIVWFQDRVLRDEWVNAIDTCIKKCRCQGGEAVALAPIWNPDSASKLCAICSNEFSFLNRKHHCRNCGCIVCDGCSRSRILINHVDQKAPVRVCNKCRDEALTNANPDRSRRHTAQINMNSVYPSSKNTPNRSNSSTNEEVNAWRDKQLLRSQSSGATPNPTSSILTRSLSGFIPSKPKPTDKAPPPPIPPSLCVDTKFTDDTNTVSSFSPTTRIPFVDKPASHVIHSSPTSQPPQPPQPPPPPPPPPRPPCPATSSSSTAETVVDKPMPRTPPPPPVSFSGQQPPVVVSQTSPRGPPPVPKKPISMNKPSPTLIAESSPPVPLKPVPVDKPPPPPPPQNSQLSASKLGPIVPPKPTKPTKPANLKVQSPGKSDFLATRPNAPPPPPVNIPESTSSSNDESADVCFPIEELRQLNSQHRVSLLARNGIEKYTSKEMYLSDIDFVNHVGCDKQTFNQWPEWKKTNKRKELGLF